MKRRVLVTGGAGFLGSNVARHLASHPSVERVVAGDIREPETLRDLLDSGAISYSLCNVTDADAVNDLIRDERIDTVVHLAAIMNPGQDVDFEYRVDVEGARNVFRACATNGVTRVVVSSSGAAYGYHSDSPAWITEDTPIRGNDEYSYSRHKRLVEEALAEYRESHPGMEQVILRIGTILGPTVKNAITGLWDGKRILKIAGTESPFVFIWVDDVARIMVRAATDGTPGIFNVAGNGALTVTELASRLGKPTLTIPAWALKVALFVGKRLKLTQHGPEQVRFLQYRPVLANDRLKSVFGYTPEKTSSEAFDAYLDTHPHVRAHK